MSYGLASGASWTTVVCVDSYQNGVPAGRFYNPCLSGGAAFRSLVQFILKMERVLEEVRFPQSFTVVRSFTHPSEERSEEAPDEREPRSGKLATFKVKILFRQNASWQGSVAWLEGRREESFRSVLELILLLNSALAGEEPET